MTLSDCLVASFQFLDNEDCSPNSFNVGGVFSVMLLDKFYDFEECI